jgi:hypothetical protein
VNDESGPTRGRLATSVDLDQEIRTILLAVGAEPWVVREREAIDHALLVKQAWLGALGLRPRELMPAHLVRELARINTGWKYVRRGAA